MCCIGSDEDCRVLSFFVATSSYSTFTSVATYGLFCCYCVFKVGGSAAAVIEAVVFAIGALFWPPESRMS